MPELTLVEDVAAGNSAVAKIQPPVAIEYLTFPEYAEWSDLETCTECDWSVSYGLGGPLDDVDHQSLDRLERSSQLSASSSGLHGSGFSAASAGFGGGGGGAVGADTATEASGTVDETPAQAEEAGEAEAVNADAAASGGNSSGGGSSASDAGSAGDGSSGASSPDAAETNLVLSPISSSADQGGGSVTSAAATASQQVVQALAEAPVGAETVHTLGEPDAIDALLDLEETTASDSGAGAEETAVPEPALLILMGLALSAIFYRMRRVVRP